MITKIVSKFSSQVNIGNLALDLPNIGGVFSRGVLAGVGFFMSIFFSFLVVFWVGLSIYAGIKIISSAGSAESIEGGMKTIKNMWIGIAMGLGFFALLSLLGAFLGFGSVYDWANKLAQCNGPGSEFLFQIETREFDKLKQEGASGAFVGCCPPITGDGLEWTYGDLSKLPPGGADYLNTKCTASSLVTF